jgi:hypothetical protein
MEVGPQVDSIWPGVWERRSAHRPLPLPERVAPGRNRSRSVPRGGRPAGRRRTWGSRCSCGISPDTSRTRAPRPLHLRLSTCGDEGVFGLILRHERRPTSRTRSKRRWCYLYHELFHFYQFAHWAEPALLTSSSSSRVAADRRDMLPLTCRRPSAGTRAAHRRPGEPIGARSKWTCIARYYAPARLPRAEASADRRRYSAERLEGTASWFAYEALARAQKSASGLRDRAADPRPAHHLPGG